MLKRDPIEVQGKIVEYECDIPEEFSVYLCSPKEDSYNFYLIPMKCGCGKPINILVPRIIKLLKQGYSMEESMNKVKIINTCCRITFLSPPSYFFSSEKFRDLELTNFSPRISPERESEFEVEIENLKINPSMEYIPHQYRSERYIKKLIRGRVGGKEKDITYLTFRRSPEREKHI